MVLTDKKRYCPQVWAVPPLENSAKSLLDVAGLNYSCMEFPGWRTMLCFLFFVFFLEEQQFSQLSQVKRYFHLFKYCMVTPMNTLVAEMLSEALIEPLLHFSLCFIIAFQHSSEINCLYFSISPRHCHLFLEAFIQLSVNFTDGWNTSLCFTPFCTLSKKQMVPIALTGSVDALEVCTVL